MYENTKVCKETLGENMCDLQNSRLSNVNSIFQSRGSYEQKKYLHMIFEKPKEKPNVKATCQVVSRARKMNTTLKKYNIMI